MLGVKGDLPYLGKAGHMSRTFSMVPRQSSSNKFCNGICWACLAGKEGLSESYPFEDMGLRPKWLATMGRDPGLDLEGPLLSIPHEDPTLLFRAGLWHSLHLGAGKAFAASSIVVIVEAMDGAVETTLDHLSLDFKQYCKERKVYAYISSISRDLLAWQTAAELPTGHWHKGFMTTRLLCWLEDLLPRQFPNTDNPLLLEIASCEHHEHHRTIHLLIKFYDTYAYSFESINTCVFGFCMCLFLFLGCSGVTASGFDQA